ncbi:hypothetical protein SKUN_00270 [Spiroplasma kunkelii CR2-3x]|uniref:Uncharacterized protein n=2 Tax=Spiroplasma kunkelii TaxID=47834 RepID=A0A0K2JF29_SPIKU|nr:hypothetical protein [Spiroplasma kunkelii CR2-3x]ALA97190.1 hypothetical protein SKUN_00270 [Spiroplasma kunkelii CR2-3x]
MFNMKGAIMRFKQINLVWKINIFVKHIKAGEGKRNPFDYVWVKKNDSRIN